MLSDRDYMRPGVPASGWYRPAGSVVKPLIWANIIVFLFTGLGQSLGGQVSGLFELLHLHPYYLRQGQIWRLGTYMFVHGGFPHLFFNMWGLYLFGRLVEDRLGPQRFLRLYLFSGLLGGLAWLLTNAWGQVAVTLDARISVQALGALRQLGVQVARDGGELIAIGSVRAFTAVEGVRVVRAFGGVVGASGAVFGVMMAAAMTAPNLRILLLLPPVALKLKTFVAVYALIEISLAWFSAVGHMRSRIAHLAHLGGLLGAFLYMRHLGHPSPWASFRGLADRWRARWTRRRFRTLNETEPETPGGPSAAAVDRILDKIGREGMESLSEDERRTLIEAGRRFRDSPGR
jgi:rhomboid-like protein